MSSLFLFPYGKERMSTRSFLCQPASLRQWQPSLCSPLVSLSLQSLMNNTFGNSRLVGVIVTLSVNVNVDGVDPYSKGISNKVSRSMWHQRRQPMVGTFSSPCRPAFSSSRGSCFAGWLSHFSFLLSWQKETSRVTFFVSDVVFFVWRVVPLFCCCRRCRMRTDVEPVSVVSRRDQHQDRHYRHCCTISRLTNDSIEPTSRRLACCIRRPPATISINVNTDMYKTKKSTTPLDCLVGNWNTSTSTCTPTKSVESRTVFFP